MEKAVLFGTLAAIAAPLLLSIGFTIWDIKWNGHPYMLNTLKCTFAGILFATTVLATGSYNDEREGNIGLSGAMLVISGIIGIVIGDNAWLHALNLIGAKRVILVDSIKPFLAALLAWPILDEPMRPLGFVGMAITMTAIVVVSLEHEKQMKKVMDEETNTPESEEIVPHPEGSEISSGMNEPAEKLKIGYMWSALNVVLDVVASIMTKKYGTGFTNFEISGIRFGSSSIILLVMLFGYRLFRSTTSLKFGDKKHDSAFIERNEDEQWFQFPNIDKRALGLVLLGVVSTTYLCPALRNYAIFEIPLATFSTLNAMTPIWSIPVVYLLKHEKTTVRGLIGSVIAVAGIVPLYIEY